MFRADRVSRRRPARWPVGGMVFEYQQRGITPGGILGKPSVMRVVCPLFGRGGGVPPSCRYSCRFHREPLFSPGFAGVADSGGEAPPYICRVGSGSTRLHSTARIRHTRPAYFSNRRIARTAPGSDASGIARNRKMYSATASISPLEPEHRSGNEAAGHSGIE